MRWTELEASLSADERERLREGLRESAQALLQAIDLSGGDAAASAVIDQVTTARDQLDRVAAVVANAGHAVSAPGATHAVAPRPAVLAARPDLTGAITAPPSDPTARSATRTALTGKTAAAIAVIAALAIFAVVRSGFPSSTGGSPGQTAPTVPAVRAVRSTVLARTGSAGLPAGDLAFLALDDSGQLTATDRQRKVVLRFGADGGVLSTWGPEIGGPTALEELAGVAARGGATYALDRKGPRIVQFDAAGRVVSILSLENLATYGPNGLVVGTDGRVYVADTGQNRILVLAPDGAAMEEWRGAATGDGQLRQPLTLAFAPDGEVFVVQLEANRIQRLDARGQSLGSWVVSFRPSGIAVDAQRRVYVTDGDNRRVRVFGPTGVPVAELGSDPAPIELASPGPLAVRADGAALYVLGRDGLARLDLESGPPPAAGTVSEGATVGSAVGNTPRASLLVERPELAAVTPILAIVAALGAAVLVFDLRAARRRGRPPARDVPLSG